MKRVGPYLILALGAVLLLAGALGYRYQRTLADPDDLSMPVSLSGLARSLEHYGEEAVTEITRLHSSAFPLVSGAMGTFGVSGEISLWAAGAPNTLIAAQMTSAMQKAIAEGRSPFSPVAEWEQSGRLTRQVIGLGQEHYYFQAGRLVIWLAADPQLAAEALSETMEYYR